MAAKSFSQICKTFTAGDVHVPTTDRPAGKKKAKSFSVINGDEMVAKGSEFSIRVPISKTNEEQRLIFGWASIIEENGERIKDHQGHVITVSELEKTFYDFAKHARGSGEMHEGSGFGDMVECMVFSKDKQEALGIDLKKIGAWVGFRVPPAIFSKVKSGEYKSFSIQGRGVLTPID